MKMNSYLMYFKLGRNKENELEQFRFVVVNLFVFFLPYDKIYSTMFLVLLITLTLFDLSMSKIRLIPRKFWIFQAIFMLSCMGYFLSVNRGEASFLIERQLAIFIFPILLPLSFEITRDRVEVILKTVALSSIIVVLLLFIDLFYTVFTLNISFSSIFSPPFFNHNFCSFIGAHASYLSIYISLALVYLLYKVSKTEQVSVLNVVKFTTVLFILMAGLFFLAAKVVVIYLILLSIIIFPFTFFKKKIKYIIFLSIILLSFFLLIFNNTDLKNRYIYTATKDLELEQRDINPFEIELNESRLQRWGIGFELVKQAPVFGSGTGDERDLMQEKYKENFLVISYIERFNVHNQYISILIKHGVIGFSIFLFALGCYLRISLNNKDYIYLFFLLGILSFFMVENVLDTNKGIFYFAFFNTLFGYSHLMNSKKM